jgi:hypothetical protein
MMKGKRQPGRKGSGDGHYVYNTRVAKASDHKGHQMEQRNEGYANRAKRVMVKKLKRATARIHRVET